MQNVLSVERSTNDAFLSLNDAFLGSTVPGNATTVKKNQNK